jgi:hypothetical protein
VAGFSDLLEQKLLDHIFTDPAYTPPATLYVGLYTAAPTDAGGGTEVTGGSYARVATAAADWSAASGTAPAQKTNTATLTFPTATASWGVVTHFGIFDASTAGNLLIWDALSASKTIDIGDTPSFAASALVMELGDPSDTY